MKFYDWRKCDLLIDGVKVTNWAPGDDVFKFERLAESCVFEVGVDGKMTVSLNADKSVQITLKLAQTSPMNSILQGICLGQDRLESFAPIQATFIDHYRRDEAGTTIGFVKKPADLVRGGKANPTEWTMVFEDGAALLGDPVFSGITSVAEAMGA